MLLVYEKEKCIFVLFSQFIKTLISKISSKIHMALGKQKRSPSSFRVWVNTQLLRSRVGGKSERERQNH